MGRDGNSGGGTGIAIGIAIGLAIGIAMDNVGVGLAIGVALGVAFGASGRSRAAKSAREDGADAETPHGDRAAGDEADEQAGGR